MSDLKQMISLDVSSVVNLFYQIDTLPDFIKAVSNELDAPTATVLWHSLSEMSDREVQHKLDSHVTLSGGIKYFVAGCPICTEPMKVATGMYENVLCPHCEKSAALDSISFDDAVQGISNELALFTEWYKLQNTKAPYRFPLDHLGVNTQWRSMFIAFMNSEEKQQFKDKRSVDIPVAPLLEQKGNH